MLQRYDISMHGEKNHISIEEFVLPLNFSRKREIFDATSQKYLLVHKVTYDGGKIHAAISKGKEALILELRSDQFYPVRPYVEIIAEKVIELSEDSSTSFSEVFFDDKDLLPNDNE